MSSDDSLDEAIAEYLDAAHEGRPPDRSAFIAQHPGHDETLRRFFESFDEMNRLFEPARTLADVGGAPSQPGPFGRYELLEEIGEGGMGKVYKARHSKLDIRVALKVIRWGLLATDEDRARFLSEAKAAAAMSHPNLVPIYDYDVHEGQPFYTMKLIEGHPLDADRRNFRSNPAEAARLVMSVARAVDHAHQRGILHRDLKPGNILIDASGAPHVTDFGLALTLDAARTATDPDHATGTLPYMSPEQLRERGRSLDRQADIWSLGVILYELLAGACPFRGDDEDQTIDDIRHRAPEPLTALNPLVSRDLEEICLKCLEKDPEKRYRTAFALSHDLGEWLNRDATRIDRLLREARRRELRNELLFASSLAADRVLMRLKDLTGAVVEVSNDPALPLLLERMDRTALQAFVDGLRRNFDDPARGLAPRGAKSPFESWVLLDIRGNMVACSPHTSIVGNNYGDREWVADALKHAGQRGADSVHVSRLFRSVVSEGRCKFGITLPVYAGRGEDAPVIGVLGASFTTDSNLCLPRLNDEQHKVLVAGRWDPKSYGDCGPRDRLVLVHPSYRAGEEPMKVRSPGFEAFVPNPGTGELRDPEPGQESVVDENFEDPLAERDHRYKGRWWAGIAPVGNTPLTVIVQRRADPLIEGGDEIVVGLSVDLSGPTGSIGEPYAQGIEAYADWFNAQGGVCGKRIRLVRVDHANRIPNALQVYDKFRTVDRVVAIQGWGTADTEALAERLSRDHIPLFSASYSARMADPARAPYNFFVVPDYSLQLRAGLSFLRDGWKESRKPRIAFLYPDVPFGRSPIGPGKAFAAELGFDVSGEEHVPLAAIDAEAAIAALKKLQPDVVWIGGSTPSTAVILKEAKRAGLRPRFLVNIWGNDADLGLLAGEASEGVLGLQASALFNDDVPGMRSMLEVTRGETRSTHYVRGWVSMMVLCEGIRRANELGDLSGPGIKVALETLRNFDTLGLTSPVTFTPDDHRPSTAVRIVEYVGGRMHPLATVDLDRRPEWLGL